MICGRGPLIFQSGVLFFVPDKSERERAESEGGRVRARVEGKGRWWRVMVVTRAEGEE